MDAENRNLLNLAPELSPKLSYYENSFTLEKHLPGSVCQPRTFYNPEFLQGICLVQFCVVRGRPLRLCVPASHRFSVRLIDPFATSHENDAECSV